MRGNRKKYRIKSLYDNKNGCDIKNLIIADGNSTRQLIQSNTIQALRDELQDAKNSIVNTAQTQTLIGALRPFPTPAYLTCSPYTAINGFNGFNNFNGCGGCGGCGCN